MNRLIIPGIVALTAVLCVIFYNQGKKEVKDTLGFGLPAFVAASSSAVQVGPQENVRVVATSTNRSYLYLANDNISSGVPIYCKADGDKEAGLNQGIKLATTTSGFYEFSPEKGNAYYGSIRCTASASSTLTITSYNLR